jgi:hypothetical protein
MEHIDFDTLKQDDKYLQHVGVNVWLMDNHKWALWVWEQHWASARVGKFTLAHADHHWDGGYDFSEHPDLEVELQAAGLEKLKGWIEEDVWIRYDSFISPAVARGRFDAVHFFCKQGDEWDVAIGKSLLDATGTEQTIHESVESFAALEARKPLIFDLCLDLFNGEPDQYLRGVLWPDDEIQAFLDAVRPLIEAAEVVTVSLSFGYSGTEADTRKLAAFVLPQLVAWRSPG